MNEDVCPAGTRRIIQDFLDIALDKSYYPSKDLVSEICSKLERIGWKPNDSPSN